MTLSTIIIGIVLLELSGLTLAGIIVVIKEGAKYEKEYKDNHNDNYDN